MKKIKPVLEGIYNNLELRRRCVPLFVSTAGLGKTMLIEEFAREKGVKLVEMIASQVSPFEVSGISIPDKKSKKMEYYNYDALDSLKDGDILFFDELLNGNITVLNAFLTLIEQRRLISGKKMPNIMICAAANPGGVAITPQIKRRFIWYNVEFNAEMWQKYMADNYNMPYNISNKLCNLIKNEKFTTNNFDTPADLDKAVRMIINDVPTPYELRLLPMLDTLIENKTGNRIPLYGDLFLEPNEKISWLKLKKIENGIID